MSVALTFASTVKTVETLETGVPAASASDKTITHDQYDETAALTASTTPPVTKCAYFLATLSGGALDIDLTALSGTNGATVVGTGLKVQAIRIKNLGANTLTIEPGDSDAYNLLGAAFKIILAQNQHITLYGNDATPDVASDAKILKLTGTTTQTSEWSVVLG